MQKAAMVKKLAAVKALAENGVGGEKETAQRMYKDLKEKYGITDEEVAAVKEPIAAEVKQEFSSIAFALWVLTNNLAEEKEFCRDCLENCRDCSTYENIKDIEKQYEEIKEQLESGCAG